MKKVFTAIVFAAIVFTGCEKKSSSQKVVRINFQTGTLCAAPVHVAMKMGLFDEELAAIGQKAEYVQVVEGGATLAEMIASGKVDAGYGLYATQLQAMENGLPISYTSGIHVGCTKYYVRADSNIYSAKDLRGKKIGVPGLADSSVMNLKRKLMDEGIGVTADNNEVEFLAYASSDLAIALNNGAVDVIGAHDPVATKGERAYKFRKILDTGIDEKFVNEYCCQQFVTHKLLKENPEGAAAVTRALQKASAFVEAEPRIAAQLQIENNLVAGDLDFNAELLDELNFIPSRSLGKKTFDSAARQLQEAGILKKTTDIEKFIAQGYIELFGVPDGYSYDSATQTYKEINGTRTSFNLKKYRRK
ncbi:ABC transporter substrate-binding protein [uncultured Treponema sp.]|uniref:ABC transporter substrate-binding protein n=1 Tax=uncultured Treponema sp. TaxID=162155 RepID=UPI0025DCB7D6|nr:ABC transporter substrate-binding protein [uncultured Treponema sp.]